MNNLKNRVNPNLLKKLKTIRGHFRRELAPLLDKKDILRKRFRAIREKSPTDRELFLNLGKEIEVAEYLSGIGLFTIESRLLVSFSNIISIDKPKKVLDSGCGTGLKTCILAALHPDVSFVGYDRIEEFIKKARDRAVSMGLNNVDFMIDNHKTFYHTQPFDMIYEMWPVRYKSDRDAVTIFRNFKAMMNPNATLVSTVYVFVPEHLLLGSYGVQEKMTEVEIERDLERQLRMVGLVPWGKHIEISEKNGTFGMVGTKGFHKSFIKLSKKQKKKQSS